MINNKFYNNFFVVHFKKIDMKYFLVIISRKFYFILNKTKRKKLDQSNPVKTNRKKMSDVIATTL